MRKLLLALLVVFGIMIPVAIVAQAHGTCSGQASSLQAGPGFVAFTGGVTCGSTPHGISDVLRIQRRTPGGSWSTVASKVLPAGVNVTSLSGYLQHNMFNCAKDYRGQSQGNASPGGHSWSKFSPVLNHTC